MERYDIVCIGQMGMGQIIPFEGPPFFEMGSPVLFCATAASRAGKRVAAVTTISKGDEYLLGPLREAGVDLFVQPGETAQYRVVFPTPNFDERQPYILKGGVRIGEIPPIEPCLAHFCCMGPRELQLSLMRSLKERGFRLSVDMQGFVLQTDLKTGSLLLEDVPEKKDILNMVDFIKLDVAEAKILTGSSIPQAQANILEGWGSREIIITSSEGVLAQRKGKSMFAQFTNSITRGRMGRGDTVIGSYLARRLDNSVEDSLRFAAALASIKLESPGPFTGSMEDVIARMSNPLP